MSVFLFVLFGAFGVLLVAIKFRNSEGSTRPELWQVMAQDLTLDDMQRQRGKVSKWLLIAAFCAWGLSSFFLVKYMTGGTMNPLLWDAEQWLNAFFALLMTAIITAFQYFLYSINQKGPAAFIGVVVCVFFGLFSEISNSMEREGATVRARSEDSSVFQATVGAISNATNTANVTASPALLKAEQAKAKALIEIEACDRHKSRGQARVDKCLRIEQGNLAQAQATINAIKSGNNEAMAANQSQALALVDKAKELSFDEAQHFEIIKLMKDWLGIAAIAASFLFSVIIMGTFEYAFHYLAVYFSALKIAIKSATGTATTTPPQPSYQPTVGAASYSQGFVGFVPPTSAVHAPQPATRTVHATAANTDTQGATRTVHAPQQNDGAFTDGIYEELKQQIIDRTISATIRPIKSYLKTKQVGASDKERQIIATETLDRLYADGVLIQNPANDGTGINKAKYILA